MKSRKTLLQKYQIPLNHLDFGYIEKCSNARELEKMVQILRSGEEGFFPDLTKRAEEKLRQLKPDSKLFRYEEPIKRRLESDEWKPIYDWTNEIKTKDNKLSALKDKASKEAKDPTYDPGLPPIRKSGEINECKMKSNAEDCNSTACSGRTQRIKSTDYRKWDKYDAEEEILKMDLAEERVKEEVECKNRLNSKLLKDQPKISEIKTNDEERKNVLKNLTDVEREQLAEEYRLRGNEYFRTKEYDSAITEYTRAIEMNMSTAAPAYNNRAITNIKLHKYSEAINDCEKCLKLEPTNLKAWLRKAEASYCYGRRREAYDIYQHALQLDPLNSTALKAIEELRTQLGDLPPPNATRIKIQEEGLNEPIIADQTSSKKSKKLSNDNVVETSSTKSQDYDLAQLVVPNRVIPSKLSKAAAVLGKSLQKPATIEPAKRADSIIVTSKESVSSHLTSPTNITSSQKRLIEEI